MNVHCVLVERKDKDGNVLISSIDSVWCDSSMAYRRSFEIGGENTNTDIIVIEKEIEDY